MRTAALLLAGLVYLAMVLFGGIQSPVLGLAFVALAAHELIAPHRAKQKR